MKKIILHACCAPCASYPIKKLIEDDYEPVVFFYNPNIFPSLEYEIRRVELEKYCKKIGVQYFEGDYEIKRFYEAIDGFENEPEKGKRCSICFDLRLDKSAQFAISKNISCFTTTLSVSPHKNSIQIFEAGRKIAQKYGVEFLEYNFKKQDGFKISRAIAKENNMYAQSYCGCEFSKDKIMLNFQVGFCEKQQLQEESSNETLSANIVFNLDKKDTNLIKLEKIKAVDLKKYNQKIANDYKIYQANKGKINDDIYNLYIILDRILRANNLQYQNWRIGLDIETDDPNAYSASANLIIVYSSLYDSLYQNPDALAFVVAHELAHLILGHGQIVLENNIKIEKIKRDISKARYRAEVDELTSTIKKSYNYRYDYGYGYGYGYNNSYSIMADGISSLGNTAIVAMLKKEMERIYAQERMLEIDADTEAMVLLTKAGFDPQKAKTAMEFFEDIPNVVTKRSTHPDVKTRLVNIDEQIKLNDVEALKNQGRKAIIDSKVLPVKKSSDKKTVVLSKESNCSKFKYVPISKEEKLIKKAYVNYLENNNTEAKDLFEQAYEINHDNFIPVLYLSYINEYEFKINKQKKSLKQAGKWARKAHKISPENKFVKKQNEDIKEILVSLKEAKKKK